MLFWRFWATQKCTTNLRVGAFTFRVDVKVISLVQKPAGLNSTLHARPKRPRAKSAAQKEAVPVPHHRTSSLLSVQHDRPAEQQEASCGSQNITWPTAAGDSCAGSADRPVAAGHFRFRRFGHPQLCLASSRGLRADRAAARLAIEAGRRGGTSAAAHRLEAQELHQAAQKSRSDGVTEVCRPNPDPVDVSCARLAANHTSGSCDKQSA